jgi:Macrocin-O-methyltransferase (TylF)
MAGPLKILRYLIPGFLKPTLRRQADRWIRARGYVPFDAAHFYAEDGLYSVHNDEFRHTPEFAASYARGVAASHGFDPGLRWRLHIALWAAQLAAQSAPGDFVECGVNAGMVSSAILHHLNFATLAPRRRYFLIDTFAGPVLDQFSAEERASGWVKLVENQVATGGYVTDLDRVRANFAEWPNAVVVPGVVPEILATLDVAQVAFLHLDLNCAAPEAAALEHFWPLMPAGAVVLMDDYAHHGVAAQKKSIDQWAHSIRCGILSLPTGQGLIVKS